MNSKIVPADAPKRRDSFVSVPAHTVNAMSSEVAGIVSGRTVTATGEQFPVGSTLVTVSLKMPLYQLTRLYVEAPMPISGDTIATLRAAGLAAARVTEHAKPEIGGSDRATA